MVRDRSEKNWEGHACYRKRDAGDVVANTMMLIQSLEVRPRTSQFSVNLVS